MKILSILLLSASLLFSNVVFSASIITFDNEAYTKKFTNKSASVNLAEYVRENETFKDWTKLVAVRNYTNLNKPKEAVVNFAKIIKQHNPKANYQILESKDGNEAQIDFLTWPKSLKYMEFNIHKYMKVEGYTGLISYQFAYRFKINEPNNVKHFKENKNRWVGEMVKAHFKINFDK